MHVLIAPNAFKHALSANDVANAIDEGIKMSRLECTTEVFPIGDGGDGTGNLISEKLNGTPIQKMVLDALGRKINASFYFIVENNSAVIELAEASGIKLLKKEECNPLRATTFGTGQLISKALDLGVKEIILCIGGSATVDGGAGILRALGIKFLNRDRNELQYLPEEFINVYEIDTSNLDKRIPQCKFTILCDVENPLLGQEGASYTFGPQKGATAEDVLKLERGLSQFAKVTYDQYGIDISKIKHGGAAGGTAAGAYAYLNAALVDGIEYFLTITGFDEVMKKTNLVITGEGSIDIQTLQGKGPAGIGKRAKSKGIPVFAFAGKVQKDIENQYKQLFDRVIAISDKEEDLETALRNTAKNLTNAAKELGDLLSHR